MSNSQTVNCPNCGAYARRHFLAKEEVSSAAALRCASDKYIIRTVCHHCDYLVTLCPRSDVVLEAYTAGFLKMSS